MYSKDLDEEDRFSTVYENYDEYKNSGRKQW